MKIEPGKYYRMRNGEKAYVVGIVPEEFKWNLPAVGIRCNVKGCIMTWGTDGWYAGPEEPHESDLVAPWDEPAPREITREIIIDGNRFKLTRIEG